MDQRLQRVLYSFGRGFFSALLVLVLEHYADLTNAIAVGDLTSLKVAAFAVLFGAVAAGLRALQAYLPSVPSPEPEEN